MAHIIIGLGNPGLQYENTRHNIGRSAVIAFAKKHGFGDFSKDKILKSLKTEGEIGSEKIKILLPETYMNRSGVSIPKSLKDKKNVLKKTIVVQDDIDLPLGTFKLSFGRGAGGHKGVESIIKSVKSNEFIRVRVGICPQTPSGKTKKPPRHKINDFVTAKFTSSEDQKTKKVIPIIVSAIEEIISSGYAQAANSFN